jgi:hypothetical protein
LFVSIPTGGNTITIHRLNNSGPIANPTLIGVSDGRTTATITVTGAGLDTACDNSTLAVTPASVSFPACGFVDISVTGGVGNYSAFSNNGSFTLIPGNPFGPGPGPANLRITRATPSPALTSPATITVRDSAPLPAGPATRTIAVSAPGTCP